MKNIDALLICGIIRNIPLEKAPFSLLMFTINTLNAFSDIVKKDEELQKNVKTQIETKEYKELAENAQKAQQAYLEEKNKETSDPFKLKALDDIRAEKLLAFSPMSEKLSAAMQEALKEFREREVPKTIKPETYSKEGLYRYLQYVNATAVSKDEKFILAAQDWQALNAVLDNSKVDPEMPAIPKPEQPKKEVKLK